MFGVFAKLPNEAEPQRQIELFPGSTAQLVGLPAGAVGLRHSYCIPPNRSIQPDISLSSDLSEEALSMPDNAGLAFPLELLPRLLQQ